MHNVEPTRLQQLAINFAEKALTLVEANERALDIRTGGTGQRKGGDREGGGGRGGGWDDDGDRRGGGGRGGGGYGGRGGGGFGGRGRGGADYGGRGGRGGRSDGYRPLLPFIPLLPISCSGESALELRADSLAARIVQVCLQCYG